MVNKGFLIVVVLMLAGCAAGMVALNPGADRIEVGKRDPDAGLKEIGPISVTDGSGCGRLGTRGNYEGAYYLLKNKGAEIGADYIQIMTMIEPISDRGCGNKYTIRGVAFKKK